MNPSRLRFRQIHLDFHVSPDVEGVGEKFNKQRWQEILKRAEVDSITLFSKCHHGWSYHDTAVGKRHPQLSFDLLRAQIDASREIGLRTPIYLSAGLDCLAASEHPEWIERDADGAPVRGKPLQPGFNKMCFFSPYLDYLCAQIEESVTLFPECDEVFLDIINQRAGCSPWAMAYMADAGLDAGLETDRRLAAAEALRRYYQRTTAASRHLRPDMPVFHNSGHIQRGDSEVNGYQSHFELESLPTGGWGYDHFPESASYVAQLGKPFLGMTGKFHTTWGEMGGFKHPNALRYECSAMLAYGAGCSVGDQPMPSMDLDPGTYENIGIAYREVKTKEPWCRGALPFVRIGVLSCQAESPGDGRNNASDTGAVRMLLEEHLPFALLDREMDFSPFAVMIFPDAIRFDEKLTAKVGSYLQAGGKVFLTGESGLRSDHTGFAFDLGADWEGASPFLPDYIQPRADLRPEFTTAPFVHYQRSQRIKVRDGQSLGEVYDPWFNRTFAHFSGHQHAPPRPDPSGYACGVRRENLVYLAHPSFAAYRAMGHLTCRRFVAKCLRHLLGAEEPVRTNLPSSARLTLTRQEEENRWMVHLLYATRLSRGGAIALDAGTVQSAGRNVEVIEELLPLSNIDVSVRVGTPIHTVRLEPQGEEIPFREADGFVHFHLAGFCCHQMVALHEWPPGSAPTQ